MDCKKRFEDHITGCPDSVKVNALLTPGGEYFWEITDHFGNTYSQPFTAGVDGFGYIDMTELPEGFCNPYMCGFEVRAKRNLSDAETVGLPMLDVYGSVYIGMRSGNVSKAWVGNTIPATVTEGGSTRLVTVLVTTNTDTVQANTLIGAEILLCLIAGTEVDYDWKDDAVFDPSTGTHHLGTTINGSPENPIKIKYLITK